MSKGNYSSEDIDVLEGLEPVRKRPAMYIGGTDARGYHHLLWEIVDNAVDEAINGHAKRIEVTLDAHGDAEATRPAPPAAGRPPLTTGRPRRNASAHDTDPARG